MCIRDRGCTPFLVGYRRCFATLEAAQSALGSHTGDGHSNRRNIDIHAALSDRPRESDYAAFYHLMPRVQGVRSVFDLGGNIGNLYYYYRRYLDWPADLRWRVMDLPDVIEAGRRTAKERQASGLSFTTRFDDASGCDLLIASGALHYFAEPLPEMIKRLECKPRYVLINRTPFTTGPAFATVQDAGSFRVACMVYNKPELLRQFELMGYRTIDEWEAAELSLTLPLDPERSPGPYAGMFLERSC